MTKPAPHKRFQLFSPILSGASLGERLWGCVGALIGICLTGFICGLVFGQNSQLPLIVAPMGASAVLLFTVPASPLAQPWPIIGGNTISAFVGVASVHFIGDPLYAVGIAVSLAILAMSFSRSLHPPGGPAALSSGKFGKGPQKIPRTHIKLAMPLATHRPLFNRASRTIKRHQVYRKRQRRTKGVGCFIA